MHTKADAGRSRAAPVCLSILFLLSLMIWQPVWAATPKSAADYYVQNLPGAPSEPQLKMHAGHVEVSPDTNGNIFFWHFQNRHIGDKQRTVIWLNGGPGCSSEDGAMMEIGPYRVRDGGKLVMNNGSWDEFANLLFIDQPVGTGFSYADTNRYLKELDEMAEDIVAFLDKWFAIFPEYVNDELYVAGESYAGQHIPYIAKAILDHNSKKSSSSKWNLAGLLIGNGWTSPTDQYPAYLKKAYQMNLISPGSTIAEQLERQQTMCMNKLDAGGKDHVDSDDCEKILQDLLRLTQDNSAAKDQRCYNMYDVRLHDEYPSCGMNWPPDLEHMTPWLRKKEVVAALNINPEKQAAWEECDGTVGSAFKARNSAPAVTLLPEILITVPILFYAGDQDLICNDIGVESLVNNLTFNGAKGFGSEKPRSWTVQDEAAGMWQSARNLTYVKFFNSSHMVPFDYPRRTRDMLDRFIGVGAPAKFSYVEGQDDEFESGSSEGDIRLNNGTTTASDEHEKGAVSKAEKEAYYRSGEVALVIILILAGALGWWVWRERRRSRLAGYSGINGEEEDGMMGGPGPTDVLNGVKHAAASGLGSLTKKKKPWTQEQRGRGDLEAADFDEGTLDEVEMTRLTGVPRHDGDGEKERFQDEDSSNGEGSSSSPRGH